MGSLIDLHCHLIPEVDDGAVDLKTSLAMARMSVADGVKVIACTPHILPGVYDNTGLDIRIILRTIGIVLFGNGFGSAGQSKLPDPGDERSDSKHAARRCEVRRPGADWLRNG